MFRSSLWWQGHPAGFFIGEPDWSGLGMFLVIVIGVIFIVWYVTKQVDD